MFLENIGIGGDPFLKNWEQRERTILLSAFAQAVRSREFSRSAGDPLVCQTVRSAVDCISQTFKEYDKDDPRLDRNRLPSRILQQQFKGYKARDPKEKQQKAIPMSMIRNLHSLKTNFDIAIANLLTVAIFFCMRSCKYLIVPEQENRKTKLLTVGDFRFFTSSREVTYENSGEMITTVSITFVNQKDGEKQEAITLHETKDDTLCPVKAALKTVRRIMSYKSSKSETTINTYFSGNTKILISNNHALKALRDIIPSIGENKLGFSAKNIGTYSIRSGGAMAMALAKIDVYAIKLIGRWKSDAFLRYIRKQIKEFTSDISARMISNEHFSHIPKRDLKLIINKDGEAGSRCLDSSIEENEEQKVEKRNKYGV